MAQIDRGTSRDDLVGDLEPDMSGWDVLRRADLDGGRRHPAGRTPQGPGRARRSPDSRSRSATSPRPAHSGSQSSRRRHRSRPMTGRLAGGLPGRTGSAPPAGRTSPAMRMPGRRTRARREVRSRAAWSGPGARRVRSRAVLGRWLRRAATDDSDQRDGHGTDDPGSPSEHAATRSFAHLAVTR